MPSTLEGIVLRTEDSSPLPHFPVPHKYLFFLIRNLKMYDLPKQIYKNDTIGSIIGMPTLNCLLTNNNTDIKGCTKVLLDTL